VEKLKVNAVSCQGCQMAYFENKNINLGKFWRELQWMILFYFMAIRFILWPFGIFCGHLVYFVAILYILLPFGIFYGYLVYISRSGLFLL
jgi:hypothetical protein